MWVMDRKQDALRWSIFTGSVTNVGPKILYSMATTIHLGKHYRISGYVGVVSKLSVLMTFPYWNLLYRICLDGLLKKSLYRISK